MEKLEELYQTCLKRGSDSPDITKLSALTKPQAELVYLLLMLDAKKHNLDLSRVPYNGSCGANGGCSFDLTEISPSGLKLLNGFTS